MTIHPLVTQLRFARSEFVRALDGVSACSREVCFGGLAQDVTKNAAATKSTICVNLIPISCHRDDKVIWPHRPRAAL